MIREDMVLRQAGAAEDFKMLVDGRMKVDMVMPPAEVAILVVRKVMVVNGISRVEVHPAEVPATMEETTEVPLVARVEVGVRRDLPLQMVVVVIQAAIHPIVQEARVQQVLAGKVLRLDVLVQPAAMVEPKAVQPALPHAAAQVRAVVLQKEDK
jgi:hypothetical protein